MREPAGTRKHLAARARRRFPAGVVPVIGVALLTLSACPAAPTESPAPSPFVALQGTWAFRAGDDPTWALPRVDDSQWIPAQVPGAWPGAASADLAGGRWGWYRRRIPVPRPSGCPSCSPEGLAIAPGKIGDAYEVYVNGARLGIAGAFPPAPRQEWDRQRIFPLPAALVGSAQSVLVSLRVWSEPWQRASKAGPWGGVFLLGPADLLREHLLLMELPDLFLATFYILVGVYHLQLFRRRRELREYLWFALFAMNVAAYDFLQTQWRFRVTEDFALLKEAEFVIWFILPATAIQGIWTLIGRPAGRLMRGYQATFAVLAILGVLIPGLALNVRLVNVWEIVVLPWLLSLPVIVGAAVLRGNREARTIGIGLMLLVLAALNDLARDQGVVNTPRLLLAGFAALVFSMAISLANRFDRVHDEANALRADLELRVAARTRDLAEANERLRQLDEEKSRFFANVSHELRTPLTLLLGPLGQVLDDAALPAACQQALEIAARNGRRLLRQVNLLLDFARLEARRVELSRTCLRVAELVRGVLPEVIAAASAKGVSLSAEGLESGDPGHLSVEVDVPRMEQVLLNLLGNALKFTPRGGEIRVRLESSGGEVRICVRDTGVGIPAEELPQIFSPFRRAPAAGRSEGAGVRYRREQPGTGLGLALAREIVALHGGRIEVDSVPGKGSEFRVVLAVRDGSPGTSGGASEVAMERAARTELADVELACETGWSPPDQTAAGAASSRVLIVEDNADLRRFLADLLGGAYRLSFGADGEEGVALARRERPDLIVSDVMMPKMSGLELVHALKTDASMRHIPILLLTARAGAKGAAQALEHGADDYLGKPFDADELRARVRALLRMTELERELAQAKAHLEQKFDEKMAELMLAVTVQQALLPPQPPAVRGLEVAGHCVMAGELGGDYYDWLTVEQGAAPALAFAIGDATGHGVGAALVMAMAKAALHAELELTMDPAQVLAAVGRVLFAACRGERMMTMLFGVVSGESGELCIANAGHPFALCRSQATGGSTFLRAGGPPLGFGTGSRYQAVSHRLQAGDCLVLCSDGVLEARSAGGEAYGKRRLKAQVSAHGSLPPAQLVHALIDDVQRFRAAPEDDLTILALRASP
ncbi:MAG: SpoIIE family protein phosphatase [Candidatus Schekmanbacteria bacterium]|nr:SpoIIE family protein phosphatase [Candidatus Schekmanbacteria bacterium]